MIEMTTEQDDAAQTLALSYPSVCVHRPEAAHNYVVVEATTEQAEMNFTTAAHRVDRFLVCDDGTTYRETALGKRYQVDPARPSVQL